MDFSLKAQVILRYKIELISGTRIGGSKENIEIGGVDNPVIKLPYDMPMYTRDSNGNLEKAQLEEKYITLPKGSPYIPGSSLKGKIRSFMEWTLVEPKGYWEDSNFLQEILDKLEEIEENDLQNFLKENSNVKKETSVSYMVRKNENSKDFFKNAGSPCSCGVCSVCKIFGVGNATTVKSIWEKINKLKANNNNKKVELFKLIYPGPPRATFSDAYLSLESLKLISDVLGKEINELEETDFTELKMENVINRLTSQSANLRTNERVPAGMEFEGEIVFDIYSEEDSDLLKTLLEYMKELENKYIGGSGSRGYGRFKFKDIKVFIKWFEESDKLKKNLDKFIGEYKDLDKPIKEYKDLGELINDLNNLINDLNNKIQNLKSNTEASNA